MKRAMCEITLSDPGAVGGGIRPTCNIEQTKIKDIREMMK